MAFKMKGPGLPGFRKQQGSGFYKSNSIPMSANRSPINQGEGEKGKWIVDNTIAKGATIDAWNQLTEEEKAVYNNKFGNWKNKKKYQTENALGEIIDVVEQERIMNVYKPGTGFSYIDVWNEMPEGKKKKFKNFEDFEIQGKAWNDAQIDSVTEERKIETPRGVEYTGHQMEVEYLKNSSQHDGFPMVSVKGTGDYKDFSMTMSLAEFQAKYVEDGDLRMKNPPAQSNVEDPSLKGSNSYYISKDMLESQIIPRLELKKTNTKNQEEFIALNQGVMSPEEMNFRLANDPNLRTDVTTLSGFNTKGFGTGSSSLQALHPDSSWNDAELLAQANNIDELNKLVKTKYGENAKHPPSPGNINLNRMPFDYNDYNIVDGELVPKEGIVTHDEFNNMSLGDKRNYINKNDDFGYINTHHKKIKKSINYKQQFNKDFKEMYNKNTQEIDMSKLDIRKENGREVMYVNNRPILDVNEGNFYKNILRGVGNLEKEGYRHMLGEIAGHLYGEEMEKDIHTQDPSVYVTPEENRVFVPPGSISDESKMNIGQYKQKVTSFVSDRTNNGKKIVVQNVWDQDENKYIQHEFEMNPTQQDDFEKMSHVEYQKKYRDPASGELNFLPPTHNADILEQYLQNNPYDAVNVTETYKKSTEK